VKKTNKSFTRLLSGSLAALTAAAVMPFMSAQAATEQQLVGYRGDLNADMEVTVSDVVILSQHLSAVKPITDDALTDYADLDQNGRLNAVDLTLLKRIVLGLSEAEGIYEEVWIDDPPVSEELIDAPIKALSPTLLSTGTNHLVMFVVDFPDCSFSRSYTAEQIKEISFGAANPSSQYYPLESVIGYYERSSYGALEMEADVFLYTAKENVANYQGSDYPDTDKLVEEIMTAFDDQIDFSKYDVNNDGTMDTILLSAADKADSDIWWPISTGYYGRKKFDGVKAGNVIVGNTAPTNTAEYNSTWIHELGHAMGLPDYYKYENVQGYDYYGMNGDAGSEMMDDAYGDMCAFSKLMYGWYTPSQVQVYSGGTQTYTLESSQVAAGCVVIPRSDLNGYLSEYMILEYATNTGNNAYGVYHNRLFNGGGLRVIHCEATVVNGYWGPELKWNNYGQNYDSSNTKQRVLRLANESEGGKFFTAGQTVDGNVSGFHWYDNSGYQTVDPGVKITVDSISDGVMTLTISQN